MNKKIVGSTLIISILLAMIIPLLLPFISNIEEETNFHIWIGKPKIWYCDRILIITKENYKPPENVLKEFFNPQGNLSKLGKQIEPFPVEYSCRPDVGRCFYGGKVCFKHAVKGDGYIIEWGMYFCHNGTEVKMTCQGPKYYLIYFTGIGCPHCALTDPFLFYGILEWRQNFYFKHRPETVIIEYEIYRDRINSLVFENYLKYYNLSPYEYGGVPHVFIDKEHIIVGDLPILNYIDRELKENTINIFR